MSALALQSFGFEGQTVRALEQDGCPWFVAQDVCGCLELTNPSKALQSLDEDEKGITNTDTLGGSQQVLIISESGLYALIFRSRKPAAARFRKWVTGEVLPALRQTGHYELAPANDGGELLALDQPDDVERIKVKLTLVREARYVYGRKVARSVWERVGLPDVRTPAPPGLMLAVRDHASEDVGLWLEERCVLETGARTQATELYEDYCDFCRERGLKCETQRNFGGQLQALGFIARQSNRIWRLGLRLKD